MNHGFDTKNTADNYEVDSKSWAECWKKHHRSWRTDHRVTILKCLRVAARKLFTLWRQKRWLRKKHC